MAMSPQQVAGRQGETRLDNHYCDSRVVGMSDNPRGTAASCLLYFIPGWQQNVGREQQG